MISNAPQFPSVSIIFNLVNIIIKIPKTIQTIGIPIKTAIPASNVNSYAEKKPYLLIVNIRIIINNGIEIIHIRLVICSNFSTTNSFSSTDIGFQTEINPFPTILTQIAIKTRSIGRVLRIHPITLSNYMRIQWARNGPY